MSAQTPHVQAAMERNLRLLPWYWVLRWVWLGEAIWVIYLIEERGLTIGQVLLFGAAFSAAAVVAEVPTGIFADRYGLRNSLILASAVITVAFLGFGLSTTIPALLASLVLFGLGEAFMSGADSALLFNTLQRLGRGEEFTRRIGRMGGIQTAAVAVFTVGGGLMVRWTSLATPIVLSAVCTLPALLLAFLLVEPPREVERAGFFALGGQALRRVMRAPSMWAVILLLAVAEIGIMLMFTTQQPVVLNYGVPVWSLGLFVGAALLLSSAGSWWAAPIGQRLGLGPTLISMALLCSVTLLGGASGMIWLYPLFVMPAVGMNVLYPHVTDFLSRRVPDSQRATVLSIGSLVARLGGLLSAVLLGTLVDRSGLGGGLAVASVVLTVLALAAYVIWARSGDTQLEPAIADATR